MPRPRFVFVTGNPGKLAEARRLWGDDLESVAIDLPEIQSLDPREVVEAKAAEAWRRVGRPLVVEETGLEIDVFGGFPGPLVKWMLDAMGAEGMARAAIATATAAAATAAAAEPAALARCLLAYVDGERRVIGEGIDRGHLVSPPRGDHGFGWDPVFVPDGSELTYAELGTEEKDRRGHRGRAWRHLAESL